MDVKDTLEKIKKMLFGGEAYPSYTLQDGTVVTISALSVDGEVYVNGEPAPDGEHILSDGSKITTVAGKITAVMPAESEAVVEMSKYTLQDGTEVEISTLAEGGNVVIAGVPATEGEYILSDGTKITVDASGAIVKVEVASVDLSAPIQMSKQDFEAAQSQMEQSFAAEIDAQKSEIKSLKDTITKQAETLKQMFEVVAKLGGEPAGDPPANKKKVVQSFGLTNEKRGGIIGRYAEANKQALSI